MNKTIRTPGHVRDFCRLVKLADELGGRFLLTLLNTDDDQDFPQQQRVISIPSLRVCHWAKLAETIRGVYSEQL